jgi:hypothetical protein
MANILFILNLIRKRTTGCKRVAMRVAKTIGIMIPLAMYRKAPRATRPTRKMVTFT